MDVELKYFEFFLIMKKMKGIVQNGVTKYIYNKKNLRYLREIVVTLVLM